MKFLGVLRLLQFNRHLQRENTISEHLRDLLDVYPEVNISGIGSFVIVQKAAWIDSNSNELYPPTKTLCIGPESNIGIDFLKELTKKFKEQREIIDAITLEVAISSKELEEAGETRISELGVVKRDKNQQLSLVDVHTQWMEGTAYLPVLNLSPVKISDKQDSTSAKITVVNSSGKKELITESSSSQEVWKQSILPLIVLGLGVLLLLWYFNTRNSEKRSLEHEQTVEPSSGNLLLVDTLSSRNAKYKHFLTSEILGEGCKVVVGSYGQKINAESQSKELVKLGFHIQLSEHEDGYRVVVVFGCNNHNLKEYLDSIKTNIAPNAWYLSPLIKAEEL